MDLKEIKTLIDLMKKNDLTEFQLEREGFKIKLRKGGHGDPVLVGTYAQPHSASAAASGASAGNPAPEVRPERSEDGADIVSPMVGTFYRSPAPEAGAFVEVGSTVTEESVICIIEAMKVMNEIKAERSGVITAILSENGKPVQFGQPLFRIK